MNENWGPLRFGNHSIQSPTEATEIGIFFLTCMMDKHIQCRQNFTNSLNRRRWVFVPAQIHDHPCHISQECNWDVRTYKGE